MDGAVTLTDQGKEVVKVHPLDSVAVALVALRTGQQVTVDGQQISLRSDIPRFHKFALKAHETGETVHRFGEAIGQACTDIGLGEHVHTHNVETRLSGAQAYDVERRAATRTQPQSSGLTFQGYRRADGRVGTRNEIWIIPTVGCVARMCETAATRAQNLVSDTVDAIVAFPHVFGCSQLGDDLESTQRVLASLMAHPNAGGVVLVGLGCENNQASALLETLDAGIRDKVYCVIAQDVIDEHEACQAAISDAVAIASQARRTACDLSDLVIGLKCGGSDALSGLTANPLLGRTTNAVTVAGGGAILTEIPEIFGAEHLLMQRAQDQHVLDQLVALVNDFKDYFARHNQPVDQNPSPGNKAGGITTLEEKSLGAVQKAGQATVTAVRGYGEQAERHGLTVLEAPGNDAVSSTALAAAGANLILFTTGRGTPLGFPAPTVKISSNSTLAERKPNWIDFDAGQLLQTEDADAIDQAFLSYLCEIASGARTRNEQNDERSIAIWKRGVTL